MLSEMLIAAVRKYALASRLGSCWSFENMGNVTGEMAPAMESMRMRKMRYPTA